MSAAADSSERWLIRAGSQADAPRIAAAVHALVAELGGEPPPILGMELATRDLLTDADAGAVLVAVAEEQIVGVLAASWQAAIHIPGPYALIQDLWIDEHRRSRSIGAALLTAIADLAGERGMGRIEVGLPSERFEHLAATEAFYARNGFTRLGPRMRRSVP